MKYFLLILLGLGLNSVSGQQLFKSEKYGYSLIIPEGWRVKTQIVLPDTDAKIVDDRGNSLIVTIKPLPNGYKKTSVTRLLSDIPNEDLIDIWFPSYDNSYILRRGTTVISGKEFYFAHISTPLKDYTRLIHKMFMYNWNGNSISIDCASIDNMTEETSVYFDLMLSSFKLNREANGLGKGIAH